MPADTSAWALIMAAGSGRRFRSKLPKCLVPVAGKPLFMHSVERFIGHPAGFGVVVVVKASVMSAFRRALSSLKAAGRLVMVAGGKERSDSVKAGLEAVPGGDESIVLVHDAARPLVSEALISRVLRGVMEHGNATAAVELTDTIKEAKKGRFLRTLERRRLLAVQTPQGFRKGEFLRLLKKYPGPHPDDAMPFELAGLDAFYVRGERYNLKVTYPEDLKVVKALLR